MASRYRVTCCGPSTHRRVTGWQGNVATRWLGLSVVEAQHFTLGTASLSILGNNPHHPEVPVIDLWNSAPHEASHLDPLPHEAGHQSIKQRAIQRWENEGGEIPTNTITPTKEILK